MQSRLKHRLVYSFKWLKASVKFYIIAKLQFVFAKKPVLFIVSTTDCQKDIV